MKIKENLPLIIGLSIPVVMIAAIAASIYLPALFVKPPENNFLYGNGYACRKYAIQDGKLVEQDIKLPEESAYYQTCELFIHDVKSDQSRPVSLAQAKELRLASRSFDGFEVKEGGYGSYGMFPFYYSSSENYGNLYLKKGQYTHRLKLHHESGYYYNDQQRFIGWITQGE